jgi:hypothetical protein
MDAAEESESIESRSVCMDDVESLWRSKRKSEYRIRDLVGVSSVSSPRRPPRVGVTCGLLSVGDPVCLRNFFLAASMAPGVTFVWPMAATVLGLKGVKLCDKDEDAGTSFERVGAGLVGWSFGSSDIGVTSAGEAA